MPLSDTDHDKISKLYRHSGDEFIEALHKADIVPERTWLKGLARLFSLPIADHIDPSHSILSERISEVRLTEVVSSHFLKKECIVPMVDSHDRLCIALNNPIGFGPADDLARILNLSDSTLRSRGGVDVSHEMVDCGSNENPGTERGIYFLAPKNEILAAINHLYSQTDESTRKLVENMEESGANIIKEIQETSDLLDDTSDAPVIRLVNHMISQSVKANASDIHIEPFQETIKIRYRIDGILYDLLEPPKWIQSALISRVKVMADMDIAEKRIPQDGRLEVRLGQQKIDIRISTVPTSFGERVVMRLLNKSGNLLTLHQSGISLADLETFNRLITLNNGIVLVTGPTGSGKTTTLYAALSSINSPDKNIITIEDPVEYNLQGIGQIQVNRKIGMTFAKGLRSIVRQDPDVILVGEIRDLETAEIAIQSALTGHLVFSTLHTNDSAGAVTRLVDLGVEPYLITSSVKAVAAQRLVRVLCPHCKEAYTPDVGEMNALGIEKEISMAAAMDGEIDTEALHGKPLIFRPKGCPQCFDTGYAGRQAIFEIMEIDEALKSMILATSDANQIRQEALRHGMTTLRQDGLSKVLDGITSMEEVMRVTQD